MKRLTAFVRALVAGGALVVMAGTAVAQTGRVEGTIRTVTGTPVVGARVAVVETNAAVSTDENGRYVIDGVTAGVYTVRINAIGFQVITLTEQRVTAGQTTVVDAAMEQAILRIEGVVVTGVNELSSVLASGQTLERDANLDDIDQVHLVFKTHFDLGQFGEAQRWCTEGGRHAPDDYRFTLCQLWMMTTLSRDPDVGGAWRLAGQVGTVAPGGEAGLYAREAAMIVGGVLARAGMADSADAVLTRARVDRHADPSRALARVEAIMRVLGGRHAEAVELLEAFRAVNPDHAFDFEGDLRWYWRSLEGNPRFEAMRERRQF